MADVRAILALLVPNADDAEISQLAQGTEGITDDQELVQALADAIKERRKETRSACH